MGRLTFLTYVAAALLALSGCQSDHAAYPQSAVDQAVAAAPAPAEVAAPAVQTPVVPEVKPVAAPAPEEPVGAVARSVAAVARAPKFALRVNCGSAAEYKDSAGNVWSADQVKGPGNTWGALGGLTIERTHQLDIQPNCPSPEIYRTERYSMEGYEFAVPDGTYTVKLHFAETYDGVTGVGGRVFGISINGKTVANDFDPFKAAGGANKMVVAEFGYIEAVDGKITIGFTPGVQNPEINGIEILQR